VIDLFPAAAPRPCRIEYEDGTVTAIRSYDPATQRSVAETDLLIVDAASEIVPCPIDNDSSIAGREHHLSQYYPKLESVFDYIPNASFVVETQAEARLSGLFAQITDAFASRSDRRPGTTSRRPPAPPEKLYLSRANWDRAISRNLIATAEQQRQGEAVPRFARERNPQRSLAAYLKERAAAGDKIVLTAVAERDTRMLARVAERALGKRPKKTADWQSVAVEKRGSMLALAAPVDAGFVLSNQHITAIAASDVSGSRAGRSAEQSEALTTLGRAEFHVGGIVVHIDHGMAALEGLEQIGASEENASEAVRLRFADEAKRLVPADDIGKIWHYDSDVAMDRLVCGDVGFGKTEVALRAAAAAIFSGKQVAVIAPTTVLVRQHVETFPPPFCGVRQSTSRISRDLCRDTAGQATCSARSKRDT
jgi:transcription-repair coupling factor (superfamily II helicase)